MLQNLHQLYRRKLGAADGDIGHVKDFAYEEGSWMVRYLIAATGCWLPSRQVLLTPQAFGLRPFGVSPDQPDVLRVSLNRKKIADGPFIAAGRAITREDEEAYYEYHGLQVYWRPSDAKGAPAFPARPPASAAGEDARTSGPRLRSTRALTGYQLRATDGLIGSVRDLRVDDKTWEIVEFVVEIGRWFAGKKIAIRPGVIERIDHADSTIRVHLSLRDIRHTMRNDVAQIGAGYR